MDINHILPPKEQGSHLQDGTKKLQHRSVFFLGGSPAFKNMDRPMNRG